MNIEQLSGEKLGNYKIKRLLGGGGGICVVDKVRQIPLDHPIASKILPQNFGSYSSFVKRFHRKAEAITKINCPNL